MTQDSLSSSEKLSSTIQQEYKILSEYKMVQSENISGIYVIPSFASSFNWFAVIFVRDGIYSDGIFRFEIHLPEHFPEDNRPPEISFSHNVFHPLICPKTGILNISDAFPEWISGESHVWQILKYVQYIFEQPMVCLGSVTNNSKETNINREAMDLLAQNKAEFILKVKECVRNCKDQIYEKPSKEDKHFIVFEKFESEVHGPVLDGIKARGISLTPPASGLSWVKEEFKPLSKPED